MQEQNLGVVLVVGAQRAKEQGMCAFVQIPDSQINNVSSRILPVLPPGTLAGAPLSQLEAPGR